MTTTVTLTPNATTASVLDTGIFGGSGSVHAALADASDATGIQGINGDSVQVQLGTSALPSGARPVLVALTYRAAAVGGGDAPTISARYVTPSQGSTPFDSPVAFSTTIANALRLQNPRAPDGNYWSQASIDGLQVGWQYLGSGEFRHYRAFVELTYASIPVVDVTAPTGTVTSPTPSVIWTWTPDAAYSTQERYQIRVFTAAQYGIGGFDPETSPATWDSGEVLSSAASVPIGTPLSDGVTYRAYVRAAASVLGAPHWSLWDFLGFTVDVADPAVPLLSVFADDDDARIMLQARRQAGSAVTDYLQFQRSRDGGTTWEDVRGSAFDDLLPASTVTLWWDGETGDGESVRYRARAISNDAGLTSLTVSAWTATSSAVAWNHQGEACEWWFSSPNRPALDRAFSLVYGGIPGDDLARPSGVHSVLGRSTYVVVQDVRKSATGSMVVGVLTQAELDDLLDLITLGGTLLVRAPAGDPWGERYVAILGASAPRAALVTVAWREVELAYVQVSSPSGGIDSAYPWTALS